MFYLDVQQYKAVNQKGLRNALGKAIFETFIADNSKFQARPAFLLCSDASFPLLPGPSLLEPIIRSIARSA